VRCGCEGKYEMRRVWEEKGGWRMLDVIACSLGWGRGMEIKRLGIRSSMGL
jgi:hypothetical protein